MTCVYKNPLDHWTGCGDSTTDGSLCVDKLDTRATSNACSVQMDLVNEGKVQAMSFAYANGVQIGPRDFAQVYVGDVNGQEPDDVVAVYEDGSVEVFLTVATRRAPSSRARAASASTAWASCCRAGSPG